MKIPIHIAQKIVQLSQGEIIASSSAKHNCIDEMVSEGIIERSGRIQKKLFVKNKNQLSHFLQNKYGISDLEKYIEISGKQDVQRNELIAISSNSKLVATRTFKGFLINSFSPLKAVLNHELITLDFTSGVFQFIYDFEKFELDPTITIVGIENPENFRFIEKQQYLFKNINPLFVSRYPQNQSKDLIKWLQSIPNHYLHFGDFDFAGIGIYLNEFKKHLSEKATFFVPNDIEDLIIANGNKYLYNNQKLNFKIEQIDEEILLKLIEIINKHKKGLEQEILIKL